MNIIKRGILAILMLCICLLSFAKISLAKEDTVSEELKETYLTTIAGACCLGSYLEDSSTEFHYLKTIGWQVEPFVARDGKFETHYSVVKRSFRRADVFIVALRGSKTKNDWKINLKVGKVNYGGNTLEGMQKIAKTPYVSGTPGVHGGFNSYANNVLRDSVVDKQGQLTGVFEHVKNDNKAILVLTGHSMGGAVATLLATRLADLGFPKERLKVITFGAPAIGNKQYNELYANKIDMLRITNSKDPVTGSLQTFFGGYQQCGRSKLYNIGTNTSLMQHDMSFYYDYSVIEFYKTWDAEIASGRIRPIPLSNVKENVPLAAIWVGQSPKLKDIPVMPNLRRILTEEYRSAMPSYVIINDKEEYNTSFARDKLIKKALGLGAKYTVLSYLDCERVKDKDKWTLKQEQLIFDAEGKLLSMTMNSRVINTVAGNVQSAIKLYLSNCDEMKKYMPFVVFTEEEMD